jgi:hypothetical protein
MRTLIFDSDVAKNRPLAAVWGTGLRRRKWHQFLATIFAGAEGAVALAKPTRGRGYFQRPWRYGDAAALTPGAWYWCCSTSNAASKVDRDGVESVTRRKANLARTHAVVLNDVGTKKRRR